MVYIPERRVYGTHPVSYDFRLAPASRPRHRHRHRRAGSMNVCMRYELYALCIERANDKKSHARARARVLATDTTSRFALTNVSNETVFLSFPSFFLFLFLSVYLSVCLCRVFANGNVPSVNRVSLVRSAYEVVARIAEAGLAR